MGFRPVSARHNKSRVAGYHHPRICPVLGKAVPLLVSLSSKGSEDDGEHEDRSQTSWLKRRPWSRGDGPESADAFMFFAQLRYSLP